MNIIFMGTPAFAVPSLRILYNSHHTISAVVTAPDKPKGRGQKLSESAVKVFAAGNNLNILQPEKLNDEAFINQIKQLNPDLIAVVAFRILPRAVYSIPRYGSVNLHASLLPKYRGAAPVNWAIIKGEKYTGVTTFFLRDKVDTGSIIMQNECGIDIRDNAGTLHDKLMDLGALTLYSTVNLIEEAKGSPPVTGQNEEESTHAPKIFKNDCLVNWAQPAMAVYNFIRGLSPYPGAYAVLKGKIVKFYKSGLSEVNSSVPGRLFAEGNKIYASCSDKLLEITELQPEGKRRMQSAEFLNGYSNLLS